MLLFNLELSLLSKHKSQFYWLVCTWSVADLQELLQHADWQEEKKKSHEWICQIRQKKSKNSFKVKIKHGVSPKFSAEVSLKCLKQQKKLVNVKHERAKCQDIDSIKNTKETKKGKQTVGNQLGKIK